MEDRGPTGSTNFVTLLVDFLYVLVFAVAGGPYWIWRKWKRKRSASFRRRLFGSGPIPGTEHGTIWVHAVSVGEVLAVRTLIARAKEAFPDLPIILTVTTATGLSVARSTYPGLSVLEAPFDLSFALRRFQKRTNPKLLLLAELELWPNQLQTLGRAGVPVIVANAKMSLRSARGYRRVLWIWKGFLRPVTMFLAQDEVYAGRIEALGVAGERVQVAGNLKFDNVRRTSPAADRRKLRAQHGFSDSARILVAGSTHAGEEELILAHAKHCRALMQEFRLVLAPRHPERVSEVSELCRSAFGDRIGFRSRAREVLDPDVLVVDTIGELSVLYALGEAALVGGSFVPVGGHNILEPAGFGLPILCGTHLDTVKDAATALKDAGVLRVVEDQALLGDEILRLLRDPAALAETESRAHAVLLKHQGSVNRTLRAIARALNRTTKLESESHD